jgi:hypothetical protein
MGGQHTTPPKRSRHGGSRRAGPQVVHLEFKEEIDPDSESTRGKLREMKSKMQSGKFRYK